MCVRDYGARSPPSSPAWQTRRMGPRGRERCPGAPFGLQFRRTLRCQALTKAFKTVWIVPRALVASPGGQILTLGNCSLARRRASQPQLCAFNPSSLFHASLSLVPGPRRWLRGFEARELVWWTRTYFYLNLSNALRKIGSVPAANSVRGSVSV
jgi:hypothetical protein